MIITLKAPLDIDVKRLAQYSSDSILTVTNLLNPRISILRQPGSQLIFSFGNKVDSGFTEIQTDLNTAELEEILQVIPESLSVPLALALGRANVLVSQFNSISLKHFASILPGSPMPEVKEAKTERGIGHFLRRSSQEIRHVFSNKKADKASSPEIKYTPASSTTLKPIKEIRLKDPVDIDVSLMAGYMKGVSVGNSEIVDDSTGKRILGFQKKSTDTILQSDLTARELGDALRSVPPFFSDHLTLLLAKSRIFLPRLMEVSVRNSEINLVRALLSQGESPNDRASQGMPYLFCAVQNGELELVQLLIDRQANVHETFQGETLLLLALKLGHLAIAKFLAEHDAHDPKALIYCAAYGDLDLFNLVLKKPVDVNERLDDGSGLTALMVASYFGHLNLVESLMQLGACPALPKDNDNTEVYWATQSGFHEIVALLLKQWNPLYSDKEIDKALICAIQHNRASIAQLLIENGGKMSLVMDNDETLLAYAVSKNSPACVDVLLKKGATLSKIDPWRLVDEAYHRGYRDVVTVLLTHLGEEPSVYIEKRVKPRHKKITFKETQTNPAYAELLSHMNKETRIRMMQRRVREKIVLKPKKEKEHKIEQEHKIQYKETLTAALGGDHKLSMEFIQEPWGFQALEHATKIRAGQWLALDFSDPEFERNIYKALRLDFKSQSTDEMLTALMLHSVKEMFQGEERCVLRQHAYDGRGPYGPEKIDYATPRELVDFYHQLADVPATERCYFSIDCSRRFEFLFLHAVLGQKHILTDMKYRQFLIAAIKKMPISKQEKNALEIQVTSDFVSEETDERIVLNISSALKTAYPEIQEFYNVQKSRNSKDNADYQSPKFFAATFVTGEQDPSIELSPEYDEKNPESPLLCLIIPSVATFKTLEHAMHGEKYSVTPVFSAGPLSLRLLRDKDDNGMRVLEVPHPDLVPTANPHNMGTVSRYLLLKHDFYHAWRSGSEILKDFIRYLGALEKRVKGFEMSKSILRWIDKDFGSGLSARRHYKMQGIWDGSWDSSPAVNLILFGNTPLESATASDTQLIFIIDMIKNRSLWEKLTGKSPEEQFKTNQFMLDNLREIKALMATYQENTREKSCLFYILAYRLKKRNEPCTPLKTLSVVQQFARAPELLDTLFYWTRNKGLRFRKEVVPDDVVIFDLESLNPETISDYCHAWMQTLNPAVRSGVTSPGPATFAIRSPELENLPEESKQALVLQDPDLQAQNLTQPIIQCI